MAIALMSWVVAIPLLGILTGARTMTPMAVLCWFAWLGHVPVTGTWGFWAAKPVTAIVFTVLAFGELIGDKLPKTPNRTAPGPLMARVVFGGMVGAVAATGLHGSAVEGVLLGAIGALAGTFISYQLRHWLVKVKGLPDLPVALAEDVLTVGLSIIALGIVTG